MHAASPIIIRSPPVCIARPTPPGARTSSCSPSASTRSTRGSPRACSTAPELNAADFQIAVNVSALMLSDDLRPFIENRPAAALARRVAPDYAGHLGRDVPYEWLASLRDDAAEKAAGGATAADHRAAAVPVA